jgi:SH3 domain-containing YSC84-like protein 1
VIRREDAITEGVAEAVPNKGDKETSMTMRRFFLLSLCLGLCGAAFAQESDQAKQLAKANSVLNEIMRTPDKGIPSNLLDKAVCVGIVPAHLSVAFGIGASYGRGVLVCRRRGTGHWGAPSLFTMGGGSFGFQIGGKSTDVVFIVMNPDGAKKLLQSKVTLGADASVAAGPVGRTASAETDAQMHAEILSYSRSRGLFGGLALTGAVLKQDNKENEELYGRRLTAQAILFRGVVRVPVAARPLDRSLTRYSPRGGAPFIV